MSGVDTLAAISEAIAEAAADSNAPLVAKLSEAHAAVAELIAAAQQSLDAPMTGIERVAADHRLEHALKAVQP